MNELLELNRKIVLTDYENACIRNMELHLTGDPRYSAEYVYPNQKNDANCILDKFYTHNIRVISVLKRTKVGMDGLMIEIAKNMTTIKDDSKTLLRKNVFFITAMMNVSWESQFKEKLPHCFVENVFHNGKLRSLKSKLKGIKNALLIFDEIDSGDKENQQLHSILKECGLLDIAYMESNNIRFIIVSATMVNELTHLNKWGDKHETYKMTIPESYIGTEDFIEKGIIQEFYPVNDTASATEWIQKDIILNYAKDFRIHLIRTDDASQLILENACISNHIQYRNHNSQDRIDSTELNNLFSQPLHNHLVIGIKGFYRRANLIPNSWKLKIGATHERYTGKWDMNVQVQGLPGRMSGYWRAEIENGHKTGPYRTSIDAINEYDHFYNNPLDQDFQYQTSNSSKKTFLSPHNIKNLLYVDPLHEMNNNVPIIIESIDKKFLEFRTRKNKIKFICDHIADKPEYKKLLDFIQNKDNKCIRIYEPKVSSLYKVFVEDLVHAATNNIPYNIDHDTNRDETNNWQMYMDNKKNRWCFIVWGKM
jgi:RNase P/RNase MRP subunit p29